MDPETSTALDQLFKSLQTFGSMRMAAENREMLYRYNDALMQSLHSILEDTDCDEVVKMQYFRTTMEQYTEAMTELFPKLLSKPPADDAIPQQFPLVSKSDPDRFDVIEEVEKFNPYHDSRGRFSSANGYASFTIQTKDPSKQHMADMAIAREKERAGAAGGGGAAKPKENPLNDPDTLVGAKQGDPMSRQEANQGKVNPNVNQGGGYHTNCQSCVVAYEARLRGYDVQAKPLGNSHEQHALARDPQLAWEDPKTGRMPSTIGNDKITTPAKCRTWLDETVETGARYTLQNVWKGRGNSGHIISCDKDSSGNLRLYDPQSGKTYQGADIDTYLNRCKYTATVWGISVNVSPRLTRVDNMAINTDLAKYIMEAAA